MSSTPVVTVVGLVVLAKGVVIDGILGEDVCELMLNLGVTGVGSLVLTTVVTVSLVISEVVRDVGFPVAIIRPHASKRMAS